MLLTGAAVFVALYALAAAWIVVTGDNEADPLRLGRTPAGDGVVVAGSVADEHDGEALIDAIAEATGATVIISELEIDADAEPILAPDDLADELVASLPPDGG